MNAIRCGGSNSARLHAASGDSAQSSQPQPSGPCSDSRPPQFAHQQDGQRSRFGVVVADAARDVEFNQRVRRVDLDDPNLATCAALVVVRPDLAGTNGAGIAHVLLLGLVCRLARQGYGRVADLLAAASV